MLYLKVKMKSIIYLKILHFFAKINYLPNTQNIHLQGDSVTKSCEKYQGTIGSIFKIIVSLLLQSNCPFPATHSQGSLALRLRFYADEHLEKKITYSENKVEAGVHSPAFNKHIPGKNVKQLRQNQNTLSGPSFMPLSFLQNACLLNAELEHSRYDLVSKQSRWCYFILGMCY